MEKKLITNEATCKQATLYKRSSEPRGGCLFSQEKAKESRQVTKWFGHFSYFLCRVKTEEPFLIYQLKLFHLGM